MVGHFIIPCLSARATCTGVPWIMPVIKYTACEGEFCRLRRLITDEEISMALLLLPSFKVHNKYNLSMNYTSRKLIMASQT
jgi:hypothetical protein